MSTVIQVDVEEVRFKLPEGLLVAGKSWGNEDADLKIIAVHGFLDNAASFDRFAPLFIHALLTLHKISARMVAIDLTGHGNSSHRPQLQNYDGAWISEIVTIADALGWDRFGLIGHSLVSLRLAISFTSLPFLTNLRELVWLFWLRELSPAG